jgi:hypothetical protein
MSDVQAAAAAPPDDSGAGDMLVTATAQRWVIFAFDALHSFAWPNTWALTPPPSSTCFG